MATVYVLVRDGHQHAQPAVGVGAVYDPAMDTGLGTDDAVIQADVTPVADTGTGTEVVFKAVLKALADSGEGADTISLAAAILAGDAGHGLDDATLLAALIQIVDSGIGLDDVLNLLRLQVYIRADGTVEPFGVILLRGGQSELFPSPRENAEEIPGRDGSLDFGSDLASRAMELRVGTPNLTPRQISDLKRFVAQRLRPTGEVLGIGWEDDPERYLEVRVAGPIRSDDYGDYLEFSIPLKASQPFYLGSAVRTSAGSGTVTSEGNVETPTTVTIRGPVTNPSVAVAGASFAWAGTVGAGDELVVDSEHLTVTFNGVNALSGFSGTFPVLQPGGNIITAAEGGATTTLWRDRWI